MKSAFDNKKYLRLQRREILKRVKKFDSKLYIEVGGKIFDDLHASRVLPGFEPDDKVRVLRKLKDKIEILFCVSAKHIQAGKKRGDYNISYREETQRIISELRNRGLYVSAVIITLYSGEPLADEFANELKEAGERVFMHKVIKGYPDDIEKVVSEEGYGANEYVPTTRPIVVVSAPGPGSAKLGTCLSQLYHENKQGKKTGYAKYESFPIWNLPVSHPVNIAYEAATADLGDRNVPDTFHRECYGKIATSYNRDMDAFPVVGEILRRITGTDFYKSPTDMGVNMLGFAIRNNEGVRQASIEEIKNRYNKALAHYQNGEENEEVVNRIKDLLSQVDK